MSNSLTTPDRPGCLLLSLAGLLVGLVCLICGLVVVAGALVVARQEVAAIATPTLASRAALEPPAGGDPVVTPRLTPVAPGEAAAPDLAPPGGGIQATPRFSPPAPVRQQPAPPETHRWREQLFNLDFPPHDYFLSAGRLGGHLLGPRTRSAPAYRLGDTQSFITDQGRATAVLVAVTDHFYFWFDDRLRVDPTEVNVVARRWEEELFPVLSSLLGEPWTPGMDEDPHVSILHLRDFVGQELGFFDSGDEYPRSVNGSSNQQEIVYLNMTELRLGDALYFDTLIHEYQHLVQWYLDGNETVWLDEGLSQLAGLYLGYYTSDATDYLGNANTQLNAWNYDRDDRVLAHYAASYLFTVYLWEQLGDEAIRELARAPANGMQAVAQVLRGYRPETSLSGFLSDWAVANWLDDPGLDRRYGYEFLALNRPALWHRFERAEQTLGEIVPYGVHYVDIALSGDTTIAFAGDTLADLLPAPPTSGRRLWFAPGVDNIDSQLTRAFDLSGLSQATLQFWTWYDLEPDADYAYVAISDDGGASWALLLPDHASAGPFGPAFNGRSADAPDQVAGWVRESISLNSYVNQTVLIRFELLTDNGVISRGLALDDIAIPELGFGDDAERDDIVWSTDGFLRIGQQLPHEWSVQIIDGASRQVTALSLDAFNQGNWRGVLGPQGATLVVLNLTPFIYDPATYWLQVENR